MVAAPPMNSSAWTPAAAKEELATHTKQVWTPKYKGTSVLSHPPPCAQQERPRWVATAHGLGGNGETPGVKQGPPSMGSGVE